MGTWGTGIFEDDSACDFVEDIMDNQNTLKTLKNSLEKGLDFEYLDADDGTAIVVSAALIDALLNGTKYEYGDGKINLWIESNRNLNVSELKALSVKSLNSILADNSELNDLWLENEEEYPNWKRNIDDLIGRLK